MFKLNAQNSKIKIQKDDAFAFLYFCTPCAHLGIILFFPDKKKNTKGHADGVCMIYLISQLRKEVLVYVTNTKYYSITHISIPIQSNRYTPLPPYKISLLSLSLSNTQH